MSPESTPHSGIYAASMHGISLITYATVQTIQATAMAEYRRKEIFMSGFYAKICQNGHVLIECSRSSKEEFCEICGAKMLSQCPHCQTAIKEWHYNGVAVLGTPKYNRPLYCKSCGKAYPWTEAALEATALIIQEDTELSELERQNLEESLPDIIAETPKTKVASIRIKKALHIAGEFTAETIRQFVIDFDCELAKKSLGL